MKRRDKKGSHVGMILSFSLFIVFIFFLYFIFEPSLKSSDEKKLALESIETKLFEKLETDFVEILVTNASSSADCIRVSNIFDKTDYVIAKDVEGSIVPYNLAGSSIYVNWNSGLNRIKLYGANNLSNKTSDAVDITSCVGGSNIESINRQKYVSVLGLNQIITDYDNNYDELRNELGINFDYEFEFRFEDVNGNLLNATKGVNPNMIDVYARTIPVVYFDGEANIFPGSVYLRVW